MQKWESFYNPSEHEFNDKVFGRNVLNYSRARQEPVHDIAEHNFENE